MGGGGAARLKVKVWEERERGLLDGRPAMLAVAQAAVFESTVFKSDDLAQYLIAVMNN